MSDLRKFFIETCNHYKAISNLYMEADNLFKIEMWETSIGIQTEKLFLTSIEFVYTSYYPDEDIRAIESHYDDFLDSIFALVVNGYVEVSIKGEEYCIETFENLWRLWFETEDIFVIKDI